MSETFSPKQVARAIGVSESSLKRWCDRGLIPTVCTVGGHRRLPVQGVLDFIKTSQRTLAHPEVLGLPSPLGGRRRTLSDGSAELVNLLVAGDELGARRLLMDLFLDHHRVSQIGDAVLAPAFARIGELWACGDVEVYRERLACRICTRVIDEIRRLIVQPPPEAPLALGATPTGDWYELPGALVELVMRQNGWRTVSLGSNLPFETLATAALQQRPGLFWLSVSHVSNPPDFAADYGRLAATLGSNTPIVVGGRAVDENLRAAMPGANFCNNLVSLETWLKQLPQPTSETNSSSR
ncbi:B12 binding domain protein [Anatilimnocola aggregata]|uniref:B12 binding domain protein n=1 Tax=Anatilimnocola aggregata TaxID=2528021 RepID=A0A517YLG4_9BACT|nr:B12-binding domain-containing protein [Anatilimnocola aggregata]QDU31067.1 B12 binding domain protein [Anatilimnocola aggregata]